MLSKAATDSKKLSKKHLKFEENDVKNHIKFQILIMTYSNIDKQEVKDLHLILKKIYLFLI